MEYCSLMSGSWGNCHFICEGNTRILIDAGQNCKRILNNLLDAGLGNGEDIDAILLTHAHRDHVTAVSVLSKKFNIPVYATEGCFCQMNSFCKPVSEALVHVIKCEDEFVIGDMYIKSFPTSHDALDSVGYVIEANNKRIGIATDLGIVTKYVEEALVDLDILVIEANHDKEMLKNGHYAPVLKRRIAGVSGHLSNEDTANALKSMVSRRTAYIALAHLSVDNNTPELAKATITNALKEYTETYVLVLPRQSPSPRLFV